MYLHRESSCKLRNIHPVIEKVIVIRGKSGADDMGWVLLFRVIMDFGKQNDWDLIQWTDFKRSDHSSPLSKEKRFKRNGTLIA